MKIEFTAVVITALLTPAITKSSGQEPPRAGAMVQQEDKTQYVGTWEMESGDSGAHQKITLALRADNTYSKTLEARVGGSPYGGTHEGTWTAKGTVVNLSGDGKWPPYSHDLSQFRKIH